MAGTIKKNYFAAGADVNAPTDISLNAAGTGPLTARNYTLTASVGSSILTVALKNAAGADPSAGDPVSIAMRNVTAATGTYNIRTVEAALSIDVSSGATLGHLSATSDYIYVYLIDNAGTLELAVSTMKFDDSSVVSTTVMSSSSDSAIVMYSTTARTNVPCKLIGRLLSTQPTAGTWAATMTEIALGDKFLTGVRSGKVYAHGTTYNNGLAPTITLSSGGGTLSSVPFSEFIPYQTDSGTWRLRFNIVVALSVVSRTTIVIAVAGVTFYDTGAGGQSCSGDCGTTTSLGRTSVGANTSLISTEFTSVGCGEGRFSGDVRLASKPLWAY